MDFWTEAAKALGPKWELVLSYEHEKGAWRVTLRSQTAGLSGGFCREREATARTPLEAVSSLLKIPNEARTGGNEARDAYVLKVSRLAERMVAGQIANGKLNTEDSKAMDAACRRAVLDAKSVITAVEEYLGG